MKYEQSKTKSKVGLLNRPAFQLKNPLTYDNLLQFFEMKIKEDMEKHKN